ncbi:MAG: hypothetical protein PHZ20_03460 [Bacilli bacterium]|nr:hypothetical protein [Bacilli bacterium]
MDNGMWALGLLLFPLIGYAIVIFLIIKFISFVINKTKKDQPNNFIIDNNIQKQDTINLKEKTKLYKLFIIFSILTCIFLLPFVNSMTSKFPSAYPGNEASSGVITSEIANQIAVYVWTILIAYLIMLVTLIIRKTNYRKVYYPLSLFTLTIIFLNIGIIYCGHMIMWYLIVFLWPLIILLIFLAIIGNKLDNNTIKKKTVVIILISVLSILSIISMLPFISLKDKNIKRGYDADKTVETDQNNEEEKQKNKIKKEFNNLIDNNFFL